MSIEILYDWILSDSCIRGSRKNDAGVWISTSPKPIHYDPNTNILTLENKKQYRIYRDDVCKALQLHMNSFKVMEILSKMDFKG